MSSELNRIVMFASRNFFLPCLQQSFDTYEGVVSSNEIQDDGQSFVNGSCSFTANLPTEKVARRNMFSLDLAKGFAKHVLTTEIFIGMKIFSYWY
jgi:7-cyano-7-deazaguanine synthase in queuosine biosynthesis